MDYKEILESYLEGRGRFEERNGYLGMEASTIPELFVRFFEAQEVKDQQGLARMLVGDMVGDSDINPAESASLITRLCREGHAALFLEYRQKIEAEVKRYAGSWLEGDNQDQLYANDKMRWHFGLKLHSILLKLNSQVAGWLREEVYAKARSQWFKDALTDQLAILNKG